MEPHIGKIVFTVGIFILILALIPLPFLRRDSPEFVVDIVAIIVSLGILGFVILNVRKQVRTSKKNKKNREQKGK
ncbi:hypothetical protein KAX02_01400 [candidate division WOR-3 bacterium]|nr:hypothetical protein [candidate division WOR-3 bacterium]